MALTIVSTCSGCFLENHGFCLGSGGVGGVVCGTVVAIGASTAVDFGCGLNEEGGGTSGSDATGLIFISGVSLLLLAELLSRLCRRAAIMATCSANVAVGALK